MAGFIGYDVAAEIYNFLYRGTAITIDGTLWLRLLVEPSSRSGGGTETDYAGYARLALPRNSSIFGATSNGRITNTSALAFPVATSLGNGELVAFDVVDTPSGAIAKIYNAGPILPARVVAVGKAPTFRAGALVFSL